MRSRRGPTTGFKMHRVGSRRTVAAVALVVLACDVPGVHLSGPEAEPDGDGQSKPPTVRVTLEDSALAAAFGWSGGVPGAAVVLHRFIDPYQPDTLYTDSTGAVALPTLLPGWYAVAGYRQLSPAETGPTGGVIRVFGDGMKYLAGSSGDSLVLRLGADRPGSLVLSEVFSGGGTREIQYNYDAFFELYNNSDTTIFVDGMILGRAYSWVGSLLPCEDRAPYREDPLGIWSRQFHQFPGRGTEYPIGPRQVVTVAIDAADHSQIHPSLPDLSHADFELEGTADIDNPDVPNMPSPYPASTLTHGMGVLTIAAYFLALPVDASTLETQLIGSRRYARFPTDRIIDVFSMDEARPSSQPPFVLPNYCTWINREFDRLEAFYFRIGTENRTSIHRRILRQDARGPILLDVNTSFNDWLLAVYSPGRLEP